MEKNIIEIGEEEYLDLTKDVTKKEVLTIEKKPKRKISFVLIIMGLLLLVSILVSGYNFYRLEGSNWECFTDKCIEYYDKQTFLDTYCSMEESLDQEVCKFRYQNQDQSVLRSQLNDFPSDHSIFCKAFSCDTQILRRTE